MARPLANLSGQRRRIDSNRRHRRQAIEALRDPFRRCSHRRAVQAENDVNALSRADYQSGGLHRAKMVAEGSQAEAGLAEKIVKPDSGRSRLLHYVE